MSSIFSSTGGFIAKNAKTALSRTRFAPADCEFLLTANGSNNATNSTTVVDSSSSPKTCDLQGANTVQLGFSPFGAQSPGSVRLSGTSGNYARVLKDSNLFPGANEDFTWECWLYLNAAPGAQGGQIWGCNEYGLNHDYNFFIDSSRRLGSYWGVPGVNVFVSPTSLNLNQWYHLAVVRQGTGSNNIKVYIDGVLNTTGTSNSNTSNGTTNTHFTLGSDNGGDESLLNCYVTDLRLVKGTAVYTTDFARPTGRLENITNTVILLRYNNFNLVDNSGKNPLPVYIVGNAKISTAQSKFGGSSLLLDGTGDGVQVGAAANSNAFNVGTGDFTVEAWAYVSSYNATEGQVVIGATEYGGTNNWWFGLTTSGALTMNIAGTTTTADSALGTGSWKHIAAVRSGSTVTLYVDGTSVKSGTNTASLASTNNIVYVGSDAAGNEQCFNGYLDDVRFTASALYTSNFTAPTAELSSRPSVFSTVSTTVYGVYQIS